MQRTFSVLETLRISTVPLCMFLLSTLDFTLFSVHFVTGFSLSDGQYAWHKLWKFKQMVNPLVHMSTHLEIASQVVLGGIDMGIDHHQPTADSPPFPPPPIPSRS